MLTLLMILAVIISVILIAVVLVQNPKGSGLAANFATGNQFFGVKKTTDIVERLTWITAGIVMIISLIAASYNPKTGATTPQGVPGKIDKQLEEIINKKGNAPMPTSPSFEEIESEMQESEGPAQSDEIIFDLNDEGATSN